MRIVLSFVVILSGLLIAREFLTISDVHLRLTLRGAVIVSEQRIEAEQEPLPPVVPITELPELIEHRPALIAPIPPDQVGQERRRLRLIREAAISEETQSPPEPLPQMRAVAEAVHDMAPPPIRAPFAQKPAPRHEPLPWTLKFAMALLAHASRWINAIEQTPGAPSATMTEKDNAKIPEPRPPAVAANDTPLLLAPSTPTLAATMAVARNDASAHDISAVEDPARGLEISQCELIWDQMTHMTRKEWAEACRRVDGARPAAAALGTRTGRK